MSQLEFEPSFVCGLGSVHSTSVILSYFIFGEAVGVESKQMTVQVT
jgi:hypothetical protein